MRCLHCQREGLSWTERTCPHCGVSLQALLSDMLPPGTVLRETYQLEYPIGRGAYGITYKARHLTLDQIVAIKEFYPREHAIRKGGDGHVAVTPDQSDVFARNLQRFVQQGRILAQLSHRNVVQVFDLFKERGTGYLVMELVEGLTLRDVLNEAGGQPLPVERVAAVTEQLVSALAAVHEHRAYHLDIKPENVLVAHDGRVVLVDFGAARQGFSRLSTQAYTVQYAAPEVVAGDDVGPDSDVFELGMLVYEMLVGERPPCALERLLKKNDFDPVNLPEPWRGLVYSALRMKRSERPTSVSGWWQARMKPTPLSGKTSILSPPTHELPHGAIILADGSGDFASLADAVTRAAEGEILRLGPGVHRLSEPLLIGRGVVIRGSGVELTEVVYEGDQTAIRFEGRGPWTVGDLTFRRAPEKGGHVVEVRGGRILFERCRFEGATGMTPSGPAAGLRLLGRTEGVVNGCEASENGIGLHVGDKALATLEQNRLSRNEYAGISFDGYAEGTARGNDASENRSFGILVRGDAKPILEANRCSANTTAGIMFLGHGGGKAWYNECTENELHGIFVSEQGGPVLDTNQCESNKGAGIAYAGAAGGSARENECSDNAEHGILVSEQSRPSLEENCCQRNGQAGITYTDQAAGHCRGNQLLKNVRDGVSITALCAVHVVENSVVGNGGCGVSFAGQSGGMVKQNQVRENGESGVSVADDASPLVESNEIVGNKMAGLLFRGRSAARAAHNQMLRNLYGVYVDDDARPVIENSKCNDNGASGIAFFGRSSGLARENDVQGNVHGIYLDDQSKPELESNRCVANRDSGMAWFGQSGGRARGHEVAANEVFGICVSDQATPQIAGNRCYRNKGSGMHVQGSAAGAVLNNKFLQNARNGIEVHQKAQPTLENNTCDENSASGMVFVGSARGRATGNTCTHNADNGIEVRDEARPNLEGNRCTENGGSGICYGLQAGGSAVSNKASSNTQFGILVRDRAHPRLQSNECEANKESGMAWYGRAAGAATGNRCNMNEVHGILVCEEAMPDLEGNDCSGNLALDEMVPLSLAMQRAADEALQ